MQIEVVEQDGGITHVMLDGSLDIAGAAEIDMTFGVVAASKPRILVDLTKVSFMASIGIRTLIGGARAASRHSARMVCAAPNADVEAVLRRTGAAELVPIFATVDDAAAELRKA
jgi:anti-anti-sigma factor